MPDNRQVWGGNVGVANPSLGELEDAVKRLSVVEAVDDHIQNAGYPDRPGEPDCIYYMRTGQCGYGNNCRFNHPASNGQGGKLGGELPERVGQPDCVYFLKTGTCQYGLTCKYHHPPDRRGAGPVLFNILGLPMRQDEKSCPYYLRTGHCKFGAACKFHHPEPAASAGIIPPPVSGPAAAIYGASGSSPIPPPSSVTPLISGGGGIQAWPLPNNMPYVQGGLQNYVPVIIPSSQTTNSPNNWNTYLGCMNPPPPPPPSSFPTSGSDLGYYYYYKNLMDSGSSPAPAPAPAPAHMMMMSSAVPYLPERPDKPECRNFMSTGNCKYGMDCKYHHPKERALQLATNYLTNPFAGLPTRPGGQAVCSHYSLNGFCKYGQTCKFIHTSPGYSYNYGVSVPSLSVPDPAMLFPYQMVYCPETSPLPLPPPTTKSSSKLILHHQNQKKPPGKDETNLDAENSSNQSGSPISAAGSEPREGDKAN
ncbi:zinc finger CCCH domain-containing protein 5-like [Impatiens glandulifera]|uniref:zinc finger CCCH domain-containing protein 5-like n=1 Tax=Impatiens glandulifera TaxID=253017 RepID=UPI001FB18F44|nr:zinc finger CCCH domain-containing protein 5-like [Impatiens glandulifera]